METTKIDAFHKTLLSLILKNKYVVKHLTMGEKLAGDIQINDDGSIRIYTKKRILRRLCIWFGDFKDISFRDLALTLIDIIAPKSTVNEQVFDGMTKEFMEKAVRRQQYDYVIDMLFDVLRYGVNDNDYSSNYLNLSDSRLPEKQKGGERFSKISCAAVLNSGEVLDNVEVFVRPPR